MRATTPLAFAIALTTAAVAAPAIAQDQPLSIVVTTHDLNLTTAAGQRALDGRIARAARRVCASGSRSLAAISSENACIASARANAAEQLSGETTVAVRPVRASRG